MAVFQFKNINMIKDQKKKRGEKQLLQEIYLEILKLNSKAKTGFYGVKNDVYNFVYVNL